MSINTTRRRKAMRTRMTNAVAALAVVGTLALGGVAYAANGGQSNSGKAPATVAEPAGGPDTDTIQQGDQTTPDGVAGETSSAEKAGESGSEVPSNDGPGGHADEPGNPNANHQFQGNQ
jgi:hypothetical protein